MTGRASDAMLPRSQRKQDLLLASQLARGQVIGALGELADQADLAVYRVVRIRVWLSSPLVWTVASAAAALVLGARLRRVPALRLLRWGWLAWRLWRRAAPALARYRAASQTPSHSVARLAACG